MAAWTRSPDECQFSGYIPIVAFAKKREWWLKKKSDGEERDPTHTLLNGGSMCVPESDLVSLWNYVGKFGGRRPFSITELRGRGAGPLFCDVDGWSREPLCKSDLLVLAQVAAGLVRQVLESDAAHDASTNGTRNVDASCVVLTPSEVAEGKEPGTVKVSMHIIFPHTRALPEVQKAFNQQLDAAFRARKDAGIGFSGTLVADNPSSMRMPFTIKFVTHTACKGKGCAECDRRGRVEDWRYFLPAAVLDKHGNVDEAAFDVLYKDSIEVLRLTSIRSDVRMAPNASLEFDRVAAIWGLGTSATAVPRKRVRSVATREQEDDAETLDRSAGSGALVDVDHASPITHAVRAFIQSSCAPAYAKVGVNRVLVSPTLTYIVFIDGPGSRFCQNLNAEHNGKPVYFVFTANGGCRQRCSCKCDTTKDRKWGKCSEFRSDPVFLDTTTARILFSTGHRGCDSRLGRPAFTPGSVSVPHDTMRAVPLCATPEQLESHVLWRNVQVAADLAEATLATWSRALGQEEHKKGPGRGARKTKGKRRRTKGDRDE